MHTISKKYIKYKDLLYDLEELEKGKVTYSEYNHVQNGFNAEIAPIARNVITLKELIKFDVDNIISQLKDIENLIDNLPFDAFDGICEHKDYHHGNEDLEFILRGLGCDVSHAIDELISFKESMN